MNALRSDLRVIADMIEPGASVLDLGCGDGALLASLIAQKQIKGRGIELKPEKVRAAIARGVPVIQGDVNQDLGYYPDKSYDYVVLSQTLQAMQDPKAILKELMRIGNRAIVSVPNFGHWKVRADLLLRGRMPVTKTLTYQWFDTPNIHFCTITDLVLLCEAMQITIERRLCVDYRGAPSNFTGRGFLANLLGQQGVFLLGH